MARPAIMMRKDRGKLVGVDAYSLQQIDALPEGKELSVRVSVMSSTGKTEREGARGLWWGGLGVLCENVEDQRYDTPRKAHDEILRGLGFVRPRWRIDGSVTMDPVSTADGAMDDDEFSVLQERARAFVLDRIGFDPWEMWKAEKDAENANRKLRHGRA